MANGSNSCDNIVVTIDQDVVEGFWGGVTACTVGPVGMLWDIVPELADSESPIYCFVKEDLYWMPDVWVSAPYP